MNGRRQAPQLPEVKAARARVGAGRWAIGKTLLGMIFLLGAMAHAFSPLPLSQQSVLWMVLLVILSTVYVGLGLRAFSLSRQRGRRLWLPLTFAWGVAAAIMLRVLVASRG